MAESIYFPDGTHEVLLGDKYLAFTRILRDRLGNDAERAFLDLTREMRDEIDGDQSCDTQAELDEALADARDLNRKLHAANARIEELESRHGKLLSDRDGMLRAIRYAGHEILAVIRSGGHIDALRDLGEDLAVTQSYEEKEQAKKPPELSDLHIVFDMDGVLNVFVEADSVTKPFNVLNSHDFRDAKPDMFARDLFNGLRSAGANVSVLSRIYISGVEEDDLRLNLLLEQDEDKRAWCAKWLGPKTNYTGLRQVDDKILYLTGIPFLKRKNYVLIDDDTCMLSAWARAGGTGVQYVQHGREHLLVWDGHVIYPSLGQQEAEQTILSACTKHAAAIAQDGQNKARTDGEIGRMVTLSTGHITNETAEKLDRDPDTNEIGLSVYPKADSGENVGWFIYLSEAIPGSCPDDLKTVLEYASKHGCGMVCLDCDGPVIEALPAYDWEVD